MWNKNVVTILICILSTCISAPTCPLEGPVFPKPAQLAENETVKGAIANLTTIFANITAEATNYPIAIEAFSAGNHAPLFSVTHTAPKLVTQNSTGARKVDSNTVLRLRSLTKTYTIYAFLINAGGKVWNKPITKYVPELQALANRSDPVAHALLGELTQTKEIRDNVLEYGFPPLNEADRPPCGAYTMRSRAGYALETITGNSFESLLEDTVIKPLGLDNTFLKAPEDSRGIIPGNKTATGWAFDIGESAAAGNMYASVADVSALGRAILNYELLSPVMTRRWLKPFPFSPNPKALVGMPWGARRINLRQPYRHVKGANEIVDVIGESLLPAIEEAARAEAGALYNGHYVSSDSSMNSSMTITTNEKPGLSIIQWLSNGMDFGLIATVLQNDYSPVTPSISVYPTGLEGRRWKTENKMFSTDCGTCITVEFVIYGSTAMDELIFDLASSG
ncbi:beta-lactamase/transpeptidase-like protein [Biscogniauxia marginata]|nr:beta-lactamase/transpeptidase-like protein [Biscogniauxia marginata]